MEGRIAVLGDTDFVMPFSALGVDTYPVGGSDAQATQAAEKVVEGRYALVVVAENVAYTADAVFAEYQAEPTPCVIVVPFTTGSEGFAAEALGKVLKMATGIDILRD